MTTKKRIDIPLADLAGLDDYEGVCLRGEGVEFPVTVASSSGSVHVIIDGNSHWLPLSALAAFGITAFQEVESRLIPTEPGSAIVLGEGSVAVRDDDLSVPWTIRPLDGSFVTDLNDREMQNLADTHGWEPLVPGSRVDAAREEGQRAGIREVHRQISYYGFASARNAIVNLFTEVFGDES